MDLLFTEEQNILRDMVKSLCATHSTTDIVREMEDDPIGIPTGLWEQMKQAGLLGMMLPEQYGGVELNMLDCAVIYHELGRALAPGPHFVSSVMSANAILKAGSSEQKSALLPAIGSGDMIITPAWLEADNDCSAEGVQMRAELSAEGYRLNGSKRHVFFAKAAQKLLLVVRTGDAAESIGLLLVDVEAEGVELQQQLSMASDTQYQVRFNNVLVPATDRLGDEHSGWKTWQACMCEGAILQAALAAGGAEKALEITVQYSKEREQFGKPIGAFQALAHYMSDAATVIEGARTLVLEAAWAHTEGLSIARLAPMAKLFSCKTFRDTTAKCQQIYGGYGFTLEYDIQLYFRRAKQQQLNWWDSRYLKHLIACDVLDGDGVTVADPFAVD